MRRAVLTIILSAWGCFHSFPQATLPASNNNGSDSTIVVSGTVNDENGQPLIGATISVKGHEDKNASTDINGNFSISNLPPNSLLQVYYIGYQPKDVHTGTKSDSYTISLSTDASLLDEVVVVGYATQRKVDMTGAVSAINAGALSDRPITNATNALAGLAPDSA